MARTKAGSLPSYRLHKPSGKALVTINGAEIYLGDFGTPASKAEYARVIAEFVSTGQVLRKDAANVTQIYAERDADKAREVARLSG